MHKKGFNERLRRVRNLMNLTQVEFAELGGVKAVTQTNYERGLRHPTLEYIFKLEESGVDIHYLIFGNAVNLLKVSDNALDILRIYENAPEEKKNAIEYVAGIK